MLVFNNAAGTVTPNFGGVDVVGAAISQADGQKIVAAYNADKTVTVTFPSGYNNVPNTRTPGLVSVRRPLLLLVVSIQS
jgi:hypothetical protein